METIPSTKSLVLTYNDKTQVFTVNAMMRLIASIAPAFQLQGNSDIESAMVDGWVSFVWSSLEVPLEALEIDLALVDVVRADIDTSLGLVEHHLQERMFLVGDMISLADISLAVVLNKAESSGVLANKTSNILRWYKYVTQQSFFQKSMDRQLLVEP